MKPFSHIYVMNAALADLRANDGHLTIPGLKRRYPADDRVWKAAQSGDFDSYFRAGAIGPDGFPDTLNGQGGIHTSPQPWLEHFWDYFQTHHGRDDDAQAFLFGFLTHCAVDATTHDWVNYFSGGIWPPLEDLLAGKREAIENITVHLALENTLDDRLRPLVSDHRSIEVPAKALRGCLADAVLGTCVGRDANGVSFLQGTAASSLVDPFTRIIAGYHSTKPWSSAAETDTRRWFHIWFGDALDDWIERNTVAWKRIIHGDESMFSTLVEEWERWIKKLHEAWKDDKPAAAVAANVIFRLLFPMLPPNISLSEIVAEIVEGRIERFIEKAFGRLSEEMKRIFTYRVEDPEIRRLLGSQWNNARQPVVCDLPAVEDLNQSEPIRESPVVHNALVAAKLTLLSPAARRAVEQELGNDKHSAPDDFVPRFIQSLDGSGQQHTGVLGGLYSEKIFSRTSSYFTLHKGHIDKTSPVGLRRSDEARFVSVGLKTGTEQTQSDVWLGIEIQGGTIHWLELNTPLYNDRMKNEVDYYTLQVPFEIPPIHWPKLSSVRRVHLQKRKTLDDWRCQWLDVRFNAGQNHHFSVNQTFTKEHPTWSSKVVQFA